MLGFAVCKLGLTPEQYYAMTPLEFNACSDYWMAVNPVKEEVDASELIEAKHMYIAKHGKKSKSIRKNN